MKSTSTNALYLPLIGKVLYIKCVERHGSRGAKTDLNGCPAMKNLPRKLKKDIGGSLLIGLQLKIDFQLMKSHYISEYKPWKTDVPDSDSMDSGDKPSYMPGFDGLGTPLSLEDAVTTLPEMKWQLDPPNHDDYIVYTSADTAWLLSYCIT